MTTRSTAGTKWLRATLLGVALFCSSSMLKLLADEPAPDPGGYSTGGTADAQSVAGTMFVVSAPADLSDSDKKDPAKLKAYQDAKKASDV